MENMDQFDEKKTICDLCKHIREIIKYIDDPKIKKIDELINNIQYRAYAMEKGLFNSKFNVGEPIYNIMKNNLVITEDMRNEIIKILSNRWKCYSLVPTSS